jgi:hypothetical protein
MKLARLSVLLVTLTSILAAPEVFGGAGGGKLGRGGHSKSLQAATTCDCDTGYYIVCYFKDACACCDDTFQNCYNTCVSLCGGPCDY